ncbi:MAG: DNA repair protein RadA [Proteobacteria bacterium]|nr:DNA repair protein RadA [Pseudomonadota bacterium]
MSKAKTKVVFFCRECGNEYLKWQGQCSDCGQWNTLTEAPAAPKNKSTGSLGYAGELAKITPLADVRSEKQARLPTTIQEFDHVLGGGLVSDSVILIGGDPGVGKSTLLLQILAQMSADYRPLYVTGEESLQQVALRAERLGLVADHLTLLTETNVERIIHSAQNHQPKIMVVDSVQTVYTDQIPSAPGGVSQVRESTAQLVRFAKQQGVALFLIGHVTKEGAIAGPRVLEHMVDTVLYFENQNDSRFRIIRAIKNRFGAVNELGVFAMTDQGLKQVNNPSAIFLSRYQNPVSGSAVMVTWEGSRPLLVELQALVDPSHLANPRRLTLGLEQNRLSMLLAVLHRHGGIVTFDQDVFVNIVGGLKITETAADLSLLLAIISSLRNKPLPLDLVSFGEIGLAGEIRPAPNGLERLKEAAKHGFKRAIIPKSNAPKAGASSLEVMAVERLDEIFTLI